MVSIIVDPLVHALIESACPLSPADMAVYLLNSLHSLQQTLQLYEFTEHRLEMIQVQYQHRIYYIVFFPFTFGKKVWKNFNFVTRRFGFLGTSTVVNRWGATGGQCAPPPLQPGTNFLSPLAVVI